MKQRRVGSIMRAATEHASTGWRATFCQVLTQKRATMTTHENELG